MHLRLEYPEDDEYWLAIFRDGIVKPESWINVATDLVRSMLFLRRPAIEFFKAAIGAGDRLPVEQRVHGVYLMLAAYAAENLLKALIIKKIEFKADINIDSIPKAIKLHNLVSLASSAGVPVTDAGAELLMRLAHYSVWAARYPAPTALDGIKPKEIPGSESNTLNFFRGSDIRSVDQLLNYCFAALGVPQAIDPVSCGYTEKFEDWESVVMQEGVTPWK